MKAEVEGGADRQPGRHLTCALATCAAVIGTTSMASAAEPLPITYAFPSSTTVLTGDINFSVQTNPGLYLLMAEISTSSALGQDGTLADDWRVGTAQLTESDATPGSYTGQYRGITGMWNYYPGSYYWQPATFDSPRRTGPVMTLTLALPRAAEPPRPTTLSFPRARTAIREALRDAFASSYRHGLAERLAGCERLSQQRIKCQRVSWAIGDSSFRGWMLAVRRSWGVTAGGSITVTDEYCRDVGGRTCR